MMINIKWLLIITLVSGIAFAQDDDDGSLKVNGWGYFSTGRFGSGMNQKELPGARRMTDTDFSKMWNSKLMVGIQLQKAIDDHTRFSIHMGMTTAFQVIDPSTFGGGANVEYQVRKFAPFLLDARVMKDIEISYENMLRLEFGYIPVRYNPQAANLGEFLIRSMAYPTVVESGFEQATKVKVAGVRAAYDIPLGEESTLKLDNYLFMETYLYPLYDISDAFIATATLGKVLELGAGVNFHNVIAVNKNATTPGKDTTLGQRDYMWHIDSLGDTTYYTTKSTKLMFRGTFSPLAVLGMDDEYSAFGKEDLKVFAEVAILGIKNYKGWYEDIAARRPIMFGLNLPTFKALDVASLQFQYMNNPYWNTYENYLMKMNLIPYVGVNNAPRSYSDYLNDTITFPERHDDDWKWSLYLSKTVNKRIKFSLQFANDNIFKTKFMPPPPTTRKYTEIMGGTWQTKTVEEPRFDESGAPVLDPVTGLQIIDNVQEEQWGKIKDWYWMTSITIFL